jgi:hypothetical protein
VGPSRWWYGVAGLVGVLGVGAGVWLGVVAIVTYVDNVDDLQRVPLGSTGSVTFDDAGGHTVYFEEPERAFDVAVPELDVTFSCEEGFEPRLEEYGSDVTYTEGGREGTGVFSFSIPEPMSCDVSASTTGEFRPRGRLAIGESVHREPVRLGAIGGAVAIASILVAGTIALFVTLARIRAERPAFPPARP